MPGMHKVLHSDPWAAFEIQKFGCPHLVWYKSSYGVFNPAAPYLQRSAKRCRFIKGLLSNRYLKAASGHVIPNIFRCPNYSVLLGLSGFYQHFQRGRIQDENTICNFVCLDNANICRRTGESITTPTRRDGVCSGR